MSSYRSRLHRPHCWLLTVDCRRRGQKNENCANYLLRAWFDFTPDFPSADLISFRPYCRNWYYYSGSQAWWGMPYALCPMPYALCPMHVGYLMLLRKAIQTYKGYLTGSYLIYNSKQKLFCVLLPDCYFKLLIFPGWFSRHNWVIAPAGIGLLNK